MRPLSRRRDPGGIEEARRLVSRAESEALERAEELRLEAERLLQAARDRSDVRPTRADDESGAELTAVVAELADATQRAAAAEADLDALRAENAELRARLDSGAGPAAADPARRTADQDEDPETADTGTADTGTADTGTADTGAGQAREDAMRILAAAAREAEDLLTTAVETIERETAAAADLRRQAESDFAAAATAREEAAGEREAAREALAQARIEAERMIDEARRESEELEAAARAEVRSEMAALRQQFASEVSALRQAMDRARDSVEQILASEQQVG